MPEANSGSHDAIVDGIFACIELASALAQRYNKSQDMSDCNRAVEDLEVAVWLADELHGIW